MLLISDEHASETEKSRILPEAPRPASHGAPSVRPSCLLERVPCPAFVPPVSCLLPCVLWRFSSGARRRISGEYHRRSTCELSKPRQRSPLQDTIPNWLQIRLTYAHVKGRIRCVLHHSFDPECLAVHHYELVAVRQILPINDGQDAVEDWDHNLIVPFLINRILRIVVKWLLEIGQEDIEGDTRVPAWITEEQQ